jgi:hypothetical protein
MLQHQLSKMEIDFALEPERWKSYSASALDVVVCIGTAFKDGHLIKSNPLLIG